MSALLPIRPSNPDAPDAHQLVPDVTAAIDRVGKTLQGSDTMTFVHALDALNTMAPPPVVEIMRKTLTHPEIDACWQRDVGLPSDDILKFLLVYDAIHATPFSNRHEPVPTDLAASVRHACDRFARKLRVAMSKLRVDPNDPEKKKTLLRLTEACCSLPSTTWTQKEERLIQGKFVNLSPYTRVNSWEGIGVEPLIFELYPDYDAALHGRRPTIEDILNARSKDVDLAGVSVCAQQRLIIAAFAAMGPYSNDLSNEEVSAAYQNAMKWALKVDQSLDPRLGTHQYLEIMQRIVDTVETMRGHHMWPEGDEDFPSLLKKWGVDVSDPTATNPLTDCKFTPGARHAHPRSVDGGGADLGDTSLLSQEEEVACAIHSKKVASAIHFTPVNTSEDQRTRRVNAVSQRVRDLMAESKRTGKPASVTFDLSTAAEIWSTDEATVHPENPADQSNCCDEPAPAPAPVSASAPEPEPYPNLKDYIGAMRAMEGTDPETQHKLAMLLEPEPEPEPYPNLKERIRATEGSDPEAHLKLAMLFPEHATESQRVAVKDLREAYSRMALRANREALPLRAATPSQVGMRRLPHSVLHGKDGLESLHARLGDPRLFEQGTHNLVMAVDTAVPRARMGPFDYQGVHWPRVFDWSSLLYSEATRFKVEHANLEARFDALSADDSIRPNPRFVFVDYRGGVVHRLSPSATRHVMAQVGSGLLGELTMMAADVYRKTVRRGQDGEFINFASPLLLLASRNENDLRFTNVYLQRFEDCNRRGLDYMPPSETQSAEICRQVLEEEKAEAYDAERREAVRKERKARNREREREHKAQRAQWEQQRKEAERKTAEEVKAREACERSEAALRSAMHVVHTDPCMIADCAQAARRLTEALKRHRAAASESLVAKVVALRDERKSAAEEAKRAAKACARLERRGEAAGAAPDRVLTEADTAVAATTPKPSKNRRRAERVAPMPDKAPSAEEPDARKRSDNTGVERSAQRERGVDERGVRVECVVCLDAAPTFAVVPCGHRCLCSRCVVQVLATTRVCPLCRASMDGCGALQIFE